MASVRFETLCAGVRDSCTTSPPFIVGRTGRLVSIFYSSCIFEQSISGWLGSAIDLEHIQNGTTLVQADKHDLVFVPIQTLKEMCIGSSGKGSKLRRTAFGTIHPGLNLIHFDKIKLSLKSCV